MNKLQEILGMGALTLFAGCEEKINSKVEDIYIEGEVIEESRSASEYYPYAFTLKKEDSYLTFDVGGYDAAAVDSRINKGDIVRINANGIRKGQSGDSLRGANYIEIIKKNTNSF